MGSGKVTLDISEEVTLLPTSVSDELSIDIVGVLGAPAEESLILVSDGLKGELANDGADRGGGLGGGELVAEGVVALAELSDAQIPDGTVGIGDLEGGVDTASFAIGPLSRSNDAGGDLLQFPPTELLPNAAKFGWDDCGLSVGASAGHYRLDTGKGDLAGFDHLLTIFWLFVIIDPTGANLDIPN